MGKNIFCIYLIFAIYINTYSLQINLNPVCETRFLKIVNEKNDSCYEIRISKEKGEYYVIPEFNFDSSAVGYLIKDSTQIDRFWFKKDKSIEKFGIIGFKNDSATYIIFYTDSLPNFCKELTNEEKKKIEKAILDDVYSWDVILIPIGVFLTLILIYQIFK